MAEPKELGTLIVVVGKARNLPNKSRFGKQDPFCTVKIGTDKQRTKAIKRGGQHPEWDEELRFSLVEDVDDILTRSDSQNASLSSSTSQPPLPPKDTSQPGVITSAALASKSRLGPVSKKGAKTMRVACYADDAKEPELIGECVVNFEEVLKKGEVDEWYEFSHKDKYSGEVYLELTYYSNDVPPVRRNVPRPAVHNYGGAGVFDSSSSVSSLSGKPRPLSGIASSGSVSGMSLYIPPYVQHGRTPSPGPPQGQLSGSSSFMELGLPPGHGRKQSLPPTIHGQPAYQSAPYGNPPSALDALAGTVSSMSLSQSYTSRPLPSATPNPQQQLQNPAYHNHRHSMSSSVPAPWSQHLPQSQPPPPTAPHSRPVSTNDIAGWDHVTRMEEERRRQAATPVPRPTSQMAYYPNAAYDGQSYPPAQQTHVQSITQDLDHRAPSPIPPSLQPAGPPRPDYQHHPASHLGLPPPAAVYRMPSPAPTPPPPSTTAPPINTTTGHYQIPASSFGGVTQSQSQPIRQPSPRPGYYQPPDNNATQDPYREQSSGYPSSHSSSQSDHSPAHVLPPSSYPSQQQYSVVHPPPSHVSQPSISASQSDIGYYRNQPPGQPSPAPPQSSTTPEGYVPWYQQTQPATSYTPAPPRPEYGQPPPPPPQQYSQDFHQRPAEPYAPATGHYQQNAPRPPPPPRLQGVGYYPSDELYVQQRSTTPQPPPLPPLPQSDSWTSQQNYSTGQESHAYQHAQTGAYPPASSNPPAAWQSNPQPFGRTPSPAPPPASGYYQPPQEASYDAQISSTPYQPPPPNLQSTQGNLQNGWSSQTNLIPPGRSPSPNPAANARSPSPSPQGISNRASNSDWRSYMNSLGTGSGSGGYQTPPSGGDQARSPSPLPININYGGDSAQAQQPATSWYTPPPSLPASIRPPEGWKSTLPADSGSHQWKA